MKKLVRWLGIPIALVLAVASALSAAANVYAESAPTLVLRFDPANADALMKRIDLQIAVGGLEQEPPGNWQSDSIAALRSRPVNPAAVRTLGMIAEKNGETDRARELMRLSEELSRRDLLAQLWLAVDAAKRQDATATLGHIDKLLSTHERAAPIVFPILGRVLQDPEVVREFVPLIRRDRPWLRSFLSFALENSVDPKALAELVMASGGLPDAPDYRQYETDILWSLAKNREFQTGARMLLNLERATPALLADGQFDDSTLAPDLGPFAWTPSLDPDVSSAVSQAGEVDARVVPNREGTILQRVLALPPGGYRATASSQLLTDDTRPVLNLDVLCLRTGAATTLLSVTTQVMPRPRKIGGAFVVPKNCPLQRVVFSVRGDDLQIDSELTLFDIAFAKD